MERIGGRPEADKARSRSDKGHERDGKDEAHQDGTRAVEMAPLNLRLGTLQDVDRAEQKMEGDLVNISRFLAGR